MDEQLAVRSAPPGQPEFEKRGRPGDGLILDLFEKAPDWRDL